MNKVITVGECINIEATCRRLSVYIILSGYTDRDLATALGTTVQTINKWRHAHNFPDIDNMFVLSRMFGINLDDLIVPRNLGYQENDKRNLAGGRIKDYINFLRFLIKKKTKSVESSLPDKVRDYSVDGIKLLFT